MMPFPDRKCTHCGCPDIWWGGGRDELGYYFDWFKCDACGFEYGKAGEDGRRIYMDDEGTVWELWDFDAP